MDDRLEELREQKRLLQAHLDWLDKEIRAETSRHPAPDSLPKSPDAPAEPAAATTDLPAGAVFTSAPRPPETQYPPVQAPAPPAARDDPEFPLPASVYPEDFEVDHHALKSEVRRGCLIYLTLLSVIVLLSGVILYLMYS